MTMKDAEENILKIIGEIPPVPLAAGRILQLLREPAFSIGELARAISLEPLLAARILKIANSPYYGGQGKVTSLERAIVLLGEVMVKNLAFQICLQSLSRKKNGELAEELWEDAAGCAIGARLIAHRWRLADPEQAFLAGLFRHVGKIALAGRYPRAYRELKTAVERREVGLHQAEQAVFGFTHPQAGAAILQTWQLGEALVATTRHHHDPGALEKTAPQFLRLAAVVNLAGATCHRLGVGCHLPAELLDLTATPGGFLLDLSRAQARELIGAFSDAFREEREFFLPSSD